MYQAYELVMKSSIKSYFKKKRNFIDIVVLDKIDFNKIQVETEFTLDNKRRIYIRSVKRYARIRKKKNRITKS
ncbi:hypothetical protein CLCOS_42550 [Clostridium coskatii]|uniref:Uncharacterized protein n=1 Tax=Clostridium coskatii TaxID=1705578 RepID=A0A166SKW4_9CLOT|nr:hypothetical protein WX73_00942 [Clostridium coskatii]OBR89946.1 hypothetical protein CLCOS_42550 [Clostridium coskatii]